MLHRLDRRRVDVKIERAAEDALDLGLGDLLDEAVVAQAVGDQVLDGADLEPVALGERNEVRHPAPWCRPRS